MKNIKNTITTISQLLYPGQVRRIETSSRKYKNDKAKIFRGKAENHKAENTIRPKLMYIAYWRFIII